MQRRQFLMTAGAGIAATTATALPAAALADLPVLRWRMASSFPKSLDVLYGTGEQLARRVGEITAGRFEIRVFAGGEIVPALGVLDAVQQNTVECGHTVSYYYHGKNKALSLDTTIPFGLNARQLSGWIHYGGGQALLRELFAGYDVVNFPGGNTGVQMGGWFRKEIKSLADLKGLKIRIPGFGAEIFAGMGAVPQQIAGGEVYPALERGAIDAAEWTVPHDDERLGFQRVAPFYYYPGLWEPGPQLSFYVNKPQWEALPRPYQAAFEAAAQEASLLMLAAYDAKNPPALQRLAQAGVPLRRYPDDVLVEAYETAKRLYAEESARNPAFRKIYEAMLAFQQMSDIWQGVGEVPMGNFMQATRRRK